MSIAIRPELHDDLKSFSKRKGMSASTYIGNLVDQAMKLNPDDDPIVVGKPADEDVIPVVLKIPVNLRTNSEQLKKWLELQSMGILKQLSKSPNDSN